MIRSEHIEAIYPLSPLQEGMLFHSLSNPDSGFYIQQFRCSFDGSLDVSCLQRAWQQVVDRHSVLRTCFHWYRIEKIVQIVFKQTPIAFDLRDWRHMSGAEQDDQLKAFLASDRERGFDLTKVPLMRLTLMQTADDRYHFLWTHHHALLDGWSLQVVLKEVIEIYTAYCHGAEPRLPKPRPYSNYIRFLQRQDKGAAELFWREKMKGLRSIPKLSHAPQNGARSERYLRHEQSSFIAQPLTETLTARARRERLTLNTVLQCAWAILLSRYSGQSDVVFGTTVAGRPTTLEGAESMVGLFINSVPVRAKVTQRAGIWEWLQELQAEQAKISEYQYSSLIDVQGWSEIPRGSAIFETLFVFHNYPLFAFEQISSSGSEGDYYSESVGLNIREFEGSLGQNYPLALLINAGTRLSLRITCNQLEFSSEFVRQILGHLVTLLGNIATGRNWKVGDIPLLSVEERHQLLDLWNPPAVHSTNEKRRANQLFERQVELMGDSIAVVSDDCYLSYTELETRASRLAHFLRRLSVGPEVCVALCVERGVNMIVAVVGILKSGGAYVSLDPSWSTARLKFLLEQTQAMMLITEEHLMAELSEGSLKTICLDKDWPDIEVCAYGPLEDVATQENLAYILPTSGSTGRPKCVGVEHRQLTNYVRAVEELLQIGPKSRMCLVTTIAADLGYTMLYPSLCLGGVLHVVSVSVSRDPEALAEYVTQHAIDFIKTTPSHQEALMQATSQVKAIPAKALILGGELLSKDLASEVHKLRPDCRIINHYGPTECTVGAVANEADLDSIDKYGKSVFIGSPLRNLRAYALESQGGLAPATVVGELYLGGAGVARGYLRQPSLTAERFLPDPFTTLSGARMYRTGDLARWSCDGLLEYVGRVDDQVKILGYRIEPGEIEANLRQHAGIHQCAVLSRQDTENGKSLSAFIVPDQTSAPSPQELREYLKERLPAHMIPASFTFVDNLPLMANGKLDRESLLSMADTEGRAKKDAPAPRDNIEVHLVTLWEDLLGHRDVGLDDNFFDLGGHSLKAITLSSRLNEVYQSKIAAGMIFRYPTVRALAQILRREVSSTLPSTIVPLRIRGSRPPLFCIHPAGGLVHGYLELSRRLGEDQPFYGIQSVGLDGTAQPLTKIEEMAERYIQDLLQVQETGPYFIAGWSMGASVAYEMAVQMTSQNRKVALVALLDGGPISAVADAGDGPESQAYAEMQRKVLLYLASNEFGGDAEDLTALSDEDCIKYCLGRAKIVGAVPSDVHLDQFRRFITVMTTNGLARIRYNAKPYSGRVSLLRTSANGSLNSSYLLNNVPTGILDIYEVPGSHNEMMIEPHVSVLAKTLRLSMDKAMEEMNL